MQNKLKEEYWIFPSAVGVDVFAVTDVCAERVHVWFCWVPLDRCSPPTCRLGVLCLSSSSPTLSLSLHACVCVCVRSLAIKAPLSRGCCPRRSSRVSQRKRHTKQKTVLALPWLWVTHLLYLDRVYRAECVIYSGADINVHVLHLLCLWLWVCSGRWLSCLCLESGRAVKCRTNVQLSRV